MGVVNHDLRRSTPFCLHISLPQKNMPAVAGVKNRLDAIVLTLNPIKNSFTTSHKTRNKILTKPLSKIPGHPFGEGIKNFD